LTAKIVGTFNLPDLPANVPEKDQNCHSALIDSQTNRFIVSDDTYFYVQSEDLTDELVRSERKQNCHSFILSQNQYIYTLALKNDVKEEGLRLYNTNSLVDEDGISTANFLCREAIVLCNDFIDYSRTTDRFTYLKDLHCLEIVPLPHKTTIFFIGMPPREQVVCARQQNDIFMV
jgi:hypothetical protein